MALKLFLSPTTGVAGEMADRFVNTHMYTETHKWAVQLRWLELDTLPIGEECRRKIGVEG